MQIFTIARNEWSRLLMSKRGWLSITAFVLIWVVFLVYVISPAARYLSSPETGGLIGMFADQFSFSAFRNWQSIEIALYWVFTLYLLPFFTMVTAADQIASDKTRGTLRFLLLRASRLQVFFGRFIGQFGIQVLMVLITISSVLVLVAVNSPDTLQDALNEAPIVIVNLALVLLPYVALMSLVSVLASSARQATVFAIIGWILVWLVLGGSQLGTLVRTGGWDTLNLAPIPIIHTVVLLTLGWFAMHRRAL